MLLPPGPGFVVVVVVVLVGADHLQRHSYANRPSYRAPRARAGRGSSRSRRPRRCPSRRAGRRTRRRSAGGPWPRRAGTRASNRAAEAPGQGSRRGSRRARRRSTACTRRRRRRRHRRGPGSRTAHHGTGAPTVEWPLKGTAEGHRSGCTGSISDVRRNPLPRQLSFSVSHMPGILQSVYQESSSKNVFLCPRPVQTPKICTAPERTARRPRDQSPLTRIKSNCGRSIYPRMLECLNA